VKFVLNEKYDADVVMVRPLGKQVGVGVVSFVHKIVDHQQLSIVKVVQVRQPLMERHSVNLDFLARFNWKDADRVQRENGPCHAPYHRRLSKTMVPDGYLQQVSYN